MEKSIINAIEFDFIGRPPVPVISARAPATARNGGPRVTGVESWPFTPEESSRLLRVIAQRMRVARPCDLSELLQGDDVQRLMPHQVMLAAHGDFAGPQLKVDVISAVPGAPASLINPCSVGDWLGELHRRWIANGERPLPIDGTMGITMAHAACGCALHAALQGDWSCVVHGVANRRDGGETLYVALNTGRLARRCNIERFVLYADLLIDQIDIASRRVTPVNGAAYPVQQALPAGSSALSGREEEIVRLLAEGKTNMEISQALVRSVFTVKNHLRRIFTKLDVTNRTEAAARCRLMVSKPAANGGDENHCAGARTR